MAVVSAVYVTAITHQLTAHAERLCVKQRDKKVLAPVRASFSQLCLVAGRSSPSQLPKLAKFMIKVLCKWRKAMTALVQSLHSEKPAFEELILGFRKSGVPSRHMLEHASDPRGQFVCTAVYSGKRSRPHACIASLFSVISRNSFGAQSLLTLACTTSELS